MATDTATKSLNLCLDKEQTPMLNAEELQRLANNTAYLAKLDKIYEQMRQGKYHRHELIEAD